MERFPLYCGGRKTGELTLERMGNRVEIRAAMSTPGDGLYRAALVGERGEFPLGVMEPDGGCLRLCRRPYQRDISCLGMVLRGEARRSFAFKGANIWRRTDRPAELFKSAWPGENADNHGPMLWRREGECLSLALPYDRAQPFPLEKLFCLARLERMEGKCWVIYTFDREEQPVLILKSSQK